MSCDHPSCPTLVPGRPQITGYPRTPEYEDLHADAPPVVIACPGHHFAEPEHLPTPTPTAGPACVPVCALCRSTDQPPFIGGEGWVIEHYNLGGPRIPFGDILAMHFGCADDRGMMPTKQWRKQLAPRVRQWRRDNPDAA